MTNATLHTGDCLAIMPTMDADSVDTIITDPPYGLGFMGKDWDHGVPGVPFWAAALRVAKPGAMLLAFGGTRTWHRLAVAIEDAGWEIRDTLMWLYGQGFPKSHDISKAIDKAAGAEREIVRHSDSRGRYDNSSRMSAAAGALGGDFHMPYGAYDATAPATPAAALWDGWGTALKPAWEPIIVAMKPCDGTFAENALEWKVAGLWVDGGRIGICAGDKKSEGGRNVPHIKADGANCYGKYRESVPQTESGRWPANVILDDAAAAMLDAQSGERGGKWGKQGKHGQNGFAPVLPNAGEQYIGDTGGASRFFYVAKASRRERNAGLEGLPPRYLATMGDGIGQREHNEEQPGAWAQNNHPTVKPLSLMRYLARLTATPTGGVVFDPFTGSGTTGVAALLEGRSFVGCELDAEYAEIARRRIAAAQDTQPALLEIA
jgi:predicted RNA methylase